MIIILFLGIASATFCTDNIYNDNFYCGSCGTSCQGILDCSGKCISQNTITCFKGDGYCDDGSYGVTMNCAEFTYDDGDCSGTSGTGTSGTGSCSTCEIGSTCTNPWNDDTYAGSCNTDCNGKYDCSGKCVTQHTLTSFNGDGYCDDGSYGVTMTCTQFNNDGGDCGNSPTVISPSGSSTCSDCEIGSTCTDPWNDDSYAGGCSGTDCNGMYDCSGKCVTQHTLTSFNGDGYCDDGSYGVTMICSEFNFDGGDCGVTSPIISTTVTSPLYAGDMCSNPLNDNTIGPCSGDSCIGVLDCNLKCITMNTVNQYMTDGVCDNGQRFVNLKCDAFSNDGSDCIIMSTTTKSTTTKTNIISTTLSTTKNIISTSTSSTSTTSSTFTTTKNIPSTTTKNPPSTTTKNISSTTTNTPSNFILTEISFDYIENLDEILDHIMNKFNIESYQIDITSIITISSISENQYRDIKEYLLSQNIDTYNNSICQYTNWSNCKNIYGCSIGIKSRESSCNNLSKICFIPDSVKNECMESKIVYINNFLLSGSFSIIGLKNKNQLTSEIMDIIVDKDVWDINISIDNVEDSVEENSDEEIIIHWSSITSTNQYSFINTFTHSEECINKINISLKKYNIFLKNPSEINVKEGDFIEQASVIDFLKTNSDKKFYEEKYFLIIGFLTIILI